MEKLYFLGPKGTYSEIAAKKFALMEDEKYILEPISTIAKIVEMLNNDEKNIGVLPIENSIEGIVRQSLDSLYLSDVKIQAQTDIKIEHCLFSKGKKEDIKHIISHPQALAQSQKYILENFDEKIDLIETTSTAHAADILGGKDKSYAAICSLDKGIELKLNLIDRNIGDIKDNKTRFVLISKKKLILNNPLTRTSIAFNTKNESGALLKVLKIFYKYNLNLIYLESRPSKRVFGEYNFFADIDKGFDEIIEAIEEIKKECNYYKFLGSYPII